MVLGQTSKEVQKLSGFYQASKLRLLVGAGTSIQSGFPDWDELNLRLITNYLRQESQPGQEGDASSAFIRANLDELAAKLYGALGRDAAADFVLQNAHDPSFAELLAMSLYGNRGLDLPIGSVHYQLAVMQEKAEIYT